MLLLCMQILSDKGTGMSKGKEQKTKAPAKTESVLREEFVPPVNGPDVKVRKSSTLITLFIIGIFAGFSSARMMPVCNIFFLLPFCLSTFAALLGLIKAFSHRDFGQAFVVIECVFSFVGLVVAILPGLSVFIFGPETLGKKL